MFIIRARRAEEDGLASRWPVDTADTHLRMTNRFFPILQESFWIVAAMAAGAVATVLFVDDPDVAQWCSRIVVGGGMGALVLRGWNAVYGDTGT